ncbi:phosphonate metabolism transcriptional regulator PhnF [Rhizobium mongolense]|uniref:phosphonate metabolism transcriptional regulator PhnF n=1 Tax=Rhizobium mongolense TaxID=57676 RepID=UPI003558DE77
MAGSGMVLWRQIGETLIAEIERGVLPADHRLPSSEALAARFGVNRHTVLRAIGHLQAEGKVRIERGRGAYAVVNPLQYNLGPRRLFEQNLAEHNLVPSRTVLSVVECHAPGDVGEALQLPKGEQVILVTTLGEADGAPVNYGSHYIASSRLPGIGNLFRDFEGKERQQFSFLSLFNKCGVSEYRRKDVRIRSRIPSNDEARYLNIPAVEHVLATLVVSVGPHNIPLTYAETCFSSSRVELRVGF